jgi:hypothetical protein
MSKKIRPGSGDWEDWSRPVEDIFLAAEAWKKKLEGVSKPWLCWNISDRWCVVQQNLVKSVGWTPVVGFDPRVGPPPTVKDAILIDFNQSFGFEEMWMHFPVEFAFCFADRLAFWHSDLLCRKEVMKELAARFEDVADGEIAAVKENKGLRYLFDSRSKRYWELAACTTRGASRSQFEKGAGWWRRFHFHPNCKDPAEKERRSHYYYDHGVGIMYWKKNYGGVVREIDPKPLEEGHCTAIGNPNYKALNPGRNSSDKVAELDMNYDLNEVINNLNLRDLASVDSQVSYV